MIELHFAVIARVDRLGVDVSSLGVLEPFDSYRTATAGVSGHV